MSYFAQNIIKQRVTGIKYFPDRSINLLKLRWENVLSKQQEWTAESDKLLVQKVRE